MHSRECTSSPLPRSTHTISFVLLQHLKHQENVTLEYSVTTIVRVYAYSKFVTLPISLRHDMPCKSTLPGIITKSIHYFYNKEHRCVFAAQAWLQAHSQHEIKSKTDNKIGKLMPRISPTTQETGENPFVEVEAGNLAVNLHKTPGTKILSRLILLYPCRTYPKKSRIIF